MSEIQDKIAKAKAAGYSDADIAKHLGQSPEYADKIKTATSAGYKPEEIISHLADSPVSKAASEKGNTFVDGVKGLGMGAGTGFGKVILGAQRLVGKGLTALDDASGDSAPSLSGLVMGKKPPSMLERAAGALVNGVPAAALVTKGLNSVGAGKWLVDDADAGRAKLTAENAPYKAASPIANTTGEIGGSIVATLPVGGVLPNALRAVAGARGISTVSGAAQAAAPVANKIIGLATRTGQAAGVGAAYGGVTGATASGADTFGGMLEDGGRGALTGAVLSGIATPVAAGLGAVARNGAQRFSQSSAAEYAKQKVAEAFARDARGTQFTGAASNPLTQAAARLGKLGDEATLADAGGRNTNQLLDTLATLPGRTKDAAFNLLRQRTAGVGARMRDSAEGALDIQGQRLPTTVQSLITQREREAGPLYTQLRTVDITPSPKLVDVVTAADKLGATKLGREIATARQMPFSLDPGANGPARWNMGDLDHIKQGIDQVLSSSKAIGKDGKATPLGAAYEQLKTNLTREMDDATMHQQTGRSLYADARAAYAGPSKMIDAANAGKLAINRDEASITGVMRGMDDNELQAFRIGAFEGLRNKLGTQGGQTNIMNMWKEPATQEKLKAVFGDLRSYREFASSVAKEAQLKRLQSVGTGSQTAARQAGMGDLDLAALTEAGGAIGAAKSGNLLSAIGSAKNAWNRVATPQSVRDQMGALLMTKGAQAPQTLNSLEALVQRINDRNLQLSNSVGVFTGGVGARVVTPPPPQQIR